MQTDQIMSAIFLIAVLTLILPSFLSTNNKLKEFLRNLSIWAIITLVIIVIIYFIILTEKEIQLLELLLISKKPISKVNILSSVWKYSSDTDTHTVETHIYRLRKKIIDKFMDDKFILNTKDGYYL